MPTLGCNHGRQVVLGKVMGNMGLRIQSTPVVIEGIGPLQGICKM